MAESRAAAPRRGAYRRLCLCRRIIFCYFAKFMQFRVAFVGAGQINFGTDEGPWNHSARLERCVWH